MTTALVLCCGVLLLFAAAVFMWSRRVQRRIRLMNRVIDEMEEIAGRATTATTRIKSTSTNLLDSAREQITNAESTQRNNQIISERIGELTVRSQRIAEILEVIKDVANKSELLALNAALEGSKAGEAGRGFSLVATQMQRLAENVMGSVRDIKALTADIREATSASVLATEEGRKLAADTTRSARQIADIVEAQHVGTEQLTEVMDEVAAIVQRPAA